AAIRIDLFAEFDHDRNRDLLFSQQRNLRLRGKLMSPVPDSSSLENGSQCGLALVHRLLAGARQGLLELPCFLRELAGVFHAEGAGLAEAPAGRVRVRQRLASSEPRLPWTDQPVLLANAAESLTPAVHEYEGVRFLCCGVEPDRLLWL